MYIIDDSQKKILLHTTTTDGVSVIELPLEHHTNSNSEGCGSPITVQVTDDGDSLGQSQQVTAQVALLQSDSPNSSGQHYFTVTGEFTHFILLCFDTRSGLWKLR